MENFLIKTYENMNQYVQEIVKDAVSSIREKYKSFYIKFDDIAQTNTAYQEVIDKCFLQVEKEIKKLKLNEKENEKALNDAKSLIRSMFVMYDEAKTSFDVKVKDKRIRKPFSFAAAKVLNITMKKIANNQYGFDIEYSSSDGTVHYITDTQGKIIGTVGNVDLDFNKSLAETLWSKGYNIEYFHNTKHKTKVQTEHICKLSTNEDVVEFVKHVNQENVLQQ